MTDPADHYATVTIRRARSDDADAVHAMVLELAAHENTAHAVHATADDWRRMLADSDVVVLVAVAAGAPLGYVSAVGQLNLWAGDHILAMDDLYVRPQARNRGIGSRLMAALADHADTHHSGADRVAGGGPLITWGVAEDNDAGQRFYRRLGAGLRTKMVASWQPSAYTDYLRRRS